MIILNFAHPITQEQKEQIENLTQFQIKKVIPIPNQLDPAKDFPSQVREIIDSLELSSDTLQTEAILINLPSFNTFTALVLAELHGRTGYFPTVIRIRPIEGVTPLRFEVAEIINLQSIRDSARTHR